MTGTPTKERLADALLLAGLTDMAKRAGEGWYDDYESPLALPNVQLVDDLMKAGTPDAMVLAKKVMGGDFDGTRAEAEAWAAGPEGDEAIRAIMGLKRRR